MATFRGPVNLVLHDGKKLWGESVERVLKLEGAAADKFRKFAHLYKYVEDEAPQPAVEAPEPTEPKDDE